MPSPDQNMAAQCLDHSRQKCAIIDVSGNERIDVSFGNLQQMTDGIARRLINHIQLGDRVGVLLGQTPWCAAAHLALWKIGAISVPLFKLLKHDALASRIKDAGINPDQIDYINAHGTSTPAGDAAETDGVKAALGDHAYKVAVSSTKSMTGHLLGAAGAIEAIASIMSIKHSVVPPTINHTTPDEGIDQKINFTFGKSQKRSVNIALSNTFGINFCPPKPGFTLINKIISSLSITYFAASNGVAGLNTRPALHPPFLIS